MAYMGTREKIIDCLQINKAEWVSGEILSSKLDISRAAVSKSIAGLRSKGYQIESIPGKGYRLLRSPDIFSRDTISAYLQSSMFNPENFIFFEKTDSTNFRAKELAENKAIEGIVIIAEDQEKGRGRKGRSWVSAYGDSILASLILRPLIPPDKISKITLLTAVAAAEAIIECTGLAIEIKWPNDILFQGKKIAGILTEMSMEMDAVDYVIVGIGINVNTSKETMPDEVRKIATSLSMETGSSVIRAQILSSFLMKFESYYKRLESEGFGDVIEKWKKLSNFIGKKVCVEIIGKTIYGVVEDINNEGVLVLKDESGVLREIISGDVIIQPSQ